MTSKEPKAMMELHKIRAKMSAEYGKKSNREINRRLKEKTDSIVAYLNLTKAALPVGIVREKRQ